MSYDPDVETRAIRFIDRLYEGLIDGLPERSAAELRADLEELGFDVDRLLAKARARIHPDTEPEP